jgi:(E)-4-hydroxy-3-methylbut-2-enyl-diphosphate synthase
MNKQVFFLNMFPDYEPPEALKNCEKPITVAVMGCIVNGPGEAREADIGIAGGDGWGMIFEKGVQVDKLPYDQLLPALLKRIDNM